MGQPGPRSVGPQEDHPLGSDALRGADRGRGRTTSTARSGWTSRPSAAPIKNVVMGVAAAKQALADSGLEVDREQPRRHRRHLRHRAAAVHTAHGEPREVAQTRARAPCRRSSSPTCCPTRHRARSRSTPASAARTCASSRPARPARTTSARRPRGSAAATTSLRCRRDREPAARAGAHRLFEHARHGPAAAGRGHRDRLAAVRQDAQRLRPGRGCGRVDARGPRVREGARREGLRRGRGLRLCRRRVGPHPAGREGRRRAARDAPGAGAPRRAGERDRPDQPARHVDAAGRPARSAGDLGRRSATTRRTSPSRRPSR